MVSRLLTASFGVCLALLLTSCGDDADRAGAADPPPDRSTDVSQATAESEEEPALSCDESGGKVDATVTAIDTEGGIEFDWKPAKIDVAAGQEVVLKVVNRSYAVHDFSSGDCYTGNISPNETMKVSFVMPEKPVPFYCSLHPQGMTGKLLPG